MAHILSIRRRSTLLIGALVSMVLFGFVLSRASFSSGPAKIGVRFLAYTNAGAIQFQLTNESGYAVCLASNFVFVDEQGQAFGAGPYWGLPPGNRLGAHATARISIYRPLLGAPWRVQFYAEPSRMAAWMQKVKAAAGRAGLPVRNAKTNQLVGFSDLMEP